MKRIFKRLSAAVIALAVVLAAVVFDVPEKITAGAATVGGCSGHSGMTAWTSTNSLPTSGSYYLTKDVDGVPPHSIDGTLTLCLNGHKIETSSGNTNLDNHIYRVEGGGTLNLCDCQGSGKMIINGSTRRDTIYCVGTFNMYGGTLSGSSGTSNGVVSVSGASTLPATFTMYGGTISGGDGDGYGVHVSKANDTFNMRGGTISDINNSGVYNFKGTFNMYGGTISGNTANSTTSYGGGGVYNDTGTFNMYGGTISGNTTSKSGGGVYVWSGGTFTMNGGTISGNTSSSYGGGVYNGGAFTMNGGTISGNTTSKSGGGVYNSNRSAIFTMSGGTISGNTSSGGYYGGGGGVCVDNGTFIINGKVDISSNHEKESNNNVYLPTDITITIGNGFSTASKIGVSVKKPPSSGSATVDITGTYGTDIKSSFISDETGKCVTYRDSKVKLVGSHAPTQVNATSPTCITDGNIEHLHCSQCDKNFSDSACTEELTTIVDPATGHSTTKTAANAATCTEDGNKEYWYCSNCRKYFGDSECKTELTSIVDNKTGHSYSEWEFTKKPNFSETGTAERVCSNDSSHKETETVPGLNEEPWTKTETTKPTVTDNGEYTYTSDYGDITVTVPKLTDPSWTKDETTKPAENTDGEYTYTNDDFGEVRATVPKLSDTSVWTKDDTKHVDNTEEHDGRDVYNSDIYGTVEVVLPQLDHEHDWGKWSITTPPTIDTNGTATRVCKKFSSHTETITVPKLADPEWTKTENKNPTIKDNGEYTYTSENYGDVMVTVPKLSEDPWSKTETTKPTINTNGEYTYKSDYGDITVTVPKLSDETVWKKTETAKPVLDTDGEYTYESGYGKETVIVPNLSDTSVWTKDEAKHVEPTDDEDGKDVYKSEYGEIEVILPATGSISKQVQSNENAPAAKLPASGSELAEAVLTEADKSSVENDGAQIKILLIIDDATNSISAEDKTAVEKAIGGLTNYKPGQYLDVNLFKVIDGVQNPITETKAALTITFEIPAALRGSGRTYSVIRVHGGKTTVLNDLDSDPNTVTIETDKFSTYALAFQEKTTSSTPNGSGSGSRPSSGGSSRPRPTTPTTSTDNDNSDSNSSDTTSSGNDTSSGDNNSSSSDNSSGSNNSDTTSSGNETSSGENNSSSGDNNSGSNSSDTTSSGNETSSGDNNSSSGDNSSNSNSLDTTSSGDAFTSDESTHNPSESRPSEGSDNPATGIAISLVPLAAVLAVVTVAAKRKRK